MSFPTSFPNSPQGYSFGCTAYGNRHAAFEYAGNLWAFVTQDGPFNDSDPVPDYRCHAMMSSDAGLTWTEQDAANAPGDPLGTAPNFTNLDDTGTEGPQYSVAVDGSTALIFSVQLGVIFVPPSTRLPTSIQQNQLIKFDLIAKTWNNSYVTPTRVVDIQRNGSDPTDPFNTIGVTYAQLIVLGPNDYVLFFSSLPEIVGGTLAYARMSYARFDGTTMGSVVNLPDQAGNAINYWPVDAVLDENGVIRFFYQIRSFAVPSLFHISLDTGTWTFGTTQGILTANNYWENQYTSTTSTVSKVIVYTPSGGTQKVALVLETNDPGGGSPQTLSFFYADTSLADPTWHQVDITSGVDVTTGLSGTSPINLFPIPQELGGASNASIDISEKNGTIVVAWNNCFQDPDFYQIGSVIYATAPSDTLVFTSPATLFVTGPVVGIPPTVGDSAAISVTTFPMTDGVGVLADSQDLTGHHLGGGEIMQFYFISLSTPVVIVGACPSTNTLEIGVPFLGTLVAGGGNGTYAFTVLS